ncbi:MAG: transporter substrate-binding domain-containing protein [Rhodocyclaceae bacterium]
MAGLFPHPSGNPNRTRRHSATLALCALLTACLGFGTAPAAADTEVRLYRRDETPSKPQHSELVLLEALHRTEKKYGRAHVAHTGGNLPRERLLIEMIKGETVNVTIVATQPSWEASTLPIWVPVDLGLSSYRIGFVRKDGQARLNNVKTLDDLRKISVGVGLGWSSRKIMEASQLQMETARDQDALTKMLVAERVDYFPRGVNEIFSEYDAMPDRPPELAVESDLLLEFPLPTYIFVSPAAPALARRIHEGMESMVKDGTLLKMVVRNHAEMLQRARLCQRRVIHLPNPLLSADNPIQRKELWFDPFSPATGLCPTAAVAKKKGQTR